MKIDFVRNSGKFEELLQEIKKAGKEEVEIGWFSEQGNHYSGYTYPQLARVHRDGAGVPIRDVLGVSLFLKDPKSDPRMKRIIKDWLRGKYGKISAQELFRKIGVRQQRNLKNAFGHPLLGITSNPTPLIDTGDWKKATKFKVKSKGTLEG